MTLAAALEHATPAEVSPAGEITFELAGDSAHLDAPIMNGAKELLQAIGAELEGATRVQVRVPFSAARARGRHATTVGRGGEGGAVVIAADGAIRRSTPQCASSISSSWIDAARALRRDSYTR